MIMDRVIYLDNSATTPLSDEARKAIAKAMECYGNPSSLHTMGQASEKLVSLAREQILSALGVRRGQGTVVFTSCGTEATSLALFGTAYAKARRDATRILTTDSEHPATAKALEALEKQGFEIVKIPTRAGALDLDALRSALDKKIFLASFMLVNNETGALYSLKEAFSLVRRASPDAITHCDAIQAFMRVRFSPAKSVVAVDTTSAGDCFVGALVTKLSQNEPLCGAIGFATDAAAIAVSRPGAAKSIPFLNEIEG